MWVGGVRVIIPDESNRILLVCQHHEDKDIWLPPGGSIDPGETSLEAAVREVEEETGLLVDLVTMLWHVEEVGDRGQRFAVYFLGEAKGGTLALGADPEFAEDQQVLKDLRYFSQEEIGQLPYVYPPYLIDEVWKLLKDPNLRKDGLWRRYKLR